MQLFQSLCQWNQGSNLRLKSTLDRLTFVDLEMLEPGGAPQEKTLKVMVSRERECGELVLSAQLHRHRWIKFTFSN